MRSRLIEVLEVLLLQAFDSEWGVWKGECVCVRFED